MKFCENLNSDFTLKGCLFGGVKLVKNAGPDKFMYTGHGIWYGIGMVLTVVWVKMSLFWKLI